jgi:hypothetical protein
VLGEERIRARRHTFFGGNFFMLRMLTRYRNQLGVEAQSQELEEQDPDFTAESDTVRYLVKTAGRTGPFRVSAALGINRFHIDRTTTTS